MSNGFGNHLWSILEKHLFRKRNRIHPCVHHKAFLRTNDQHTNFIYLLLNTFFFDHLSFVSYLASLWNTSWSSATRRSKTTAPHLSSTSPLPTLTTSRGPVPQNPSLEPSTGPRPTLAKRVSGSVLLQSPRNGPRAASISSSYSFGHQDQSKNNMVKAEVLVINVRQLQPPPLLWVSPSPVLQTLQNQRINRKNVL